MRQFLGKSGAATVVLLRSPDPASLPKLQELRRLFGTKEIKYYKGAGWFGSEIARLERVLEVVRGTSPLPPWLDTETTDYLLLPPGTPQSLFFTIKHASILIYGFNLTDSCMSDLEGHIETLSHVIRWRNTVDGFHDSLQAQSVSAQKRNIQDPTILTPDFDLLQRIVDGYGDTALADVTADIKLWHSFYKW